MPSVSCGCFGSGVIGALWGVAFVGGGQAVGAHYSGVETGFAFEFALSVMGVLL